MEEGRSALQILIAKPTGKRPLGRPRRRWENTTGIDLKEIGIGTRNWIDSMDRKSSLTAIVEDRDNCRAIVNAALLHRVQ